MHLNTLLTLLSLSMVDYTVDSYNCVHIYSNCLPLVVLTEIKVAYLISGVNWNTSFQGLLNSLQRASPCSFNNINIAHL